MEQKCPNVKKEMPFKLQDPYRKPNRTTKTPMTHNNQTLNVQNKESILKLAIENDQVTYKVSSFRITPDFQLGLWKSESTEQYATTSERPQMPAHNTICSKTISTNQGKHFMI